MATITIKTKDDQTNYELFKSGYWLLEGKFTQWDNSEVTQLKLSLTDYVDTHLIDYVHYCKDQNTLEIHVFKGGAQVSTFTAEKKHLNGMTLAPSEKITLDFIDYIKDEKPKLELCFVDPAQNGGPGNQPERKKGNILQGGN